MLFIENFERKFIFGLTRLFSIFIILGIFMAIGIGVTLFNGIFGEVDTKVSALEVVALIKPIVVPNNTPPAGSDIALKETENLKNALPSVKIPFVLQKHFNTPEKIQLLKEWLDDLDLDAHQQFIHELASTVTEAEKLKLSPEDAILKYKELKFIKLEEEKLSKPQRKTQQLYFFAAVIGSMTLIALYSLILVLLAIERNTRRLEK